MSSIRKLDLGLVYLDAGQAQGYGVLWGVGPTDSVYVNVTPAPEYKQWYQKPAQVQVINQFLGTDKNGWININFTIKNIGQQWLFCRPTISVIMGP